MRAPSFDAELNGQSDCFKACPEFPLVVVSSSSPASTVVCIQKPSRLLLSHCHANLTKFALGPKTMQFKRASSINLGGM